jgi:hypothetical protein
MQAGEGELHLRVHPGRANHPPAVGSFRGVVQEFGLPRPGRAAQDDDGALPRLGIGEQAVERATLVPAADQWPGMGVRRARRYPPETIATTRISRAPSREESKPPRSR